MPPLHPIASVAVVLLGRLLIAGALVALAAIVARTTRR
jgi:hypothetical protein